MLFVCSLKYILDTSVLSDIRFANIYSKAKAYVFTSIKVALEEQKFLILLKPN